MKTENTALKVTLLGSNSGRNAGDAAILASIMRSLSEELDGNVEFEVPTTNPRFVTEQYGGMFKVTPVNIMPWTGSIRLLGIPTMRSIKRTDVTFITDGIIFDINLFNPLFNFLITLVFLAPWVRFCGKKLVCYNVGIGPLASFWGKRFGRWVGDASDLIIVRDEDSKKLFAEIGVTKEVTVTADAVFDNWSASEERVSELLANAQLTEEAASGTLLGVNVTRYIDRWLSQDQKVSEKQSFLPTLAESLLRLKLERGITSAIFITQVMDREYGQELQRLLSEGFRKQTGAEWKPALFVNDVLNNHEILGLARRCSLFMGMRVHSLIIACRAGTPVLGLVYAPKVRSFLKQLLTPEWAFELAEVTAEKLFSQVSSAWDQSEEIRKTQQEVAERNAEQVKVAARMIRERYRPNHISAASLEAVKSSNTAVNQ